MRPLALLLMLAMPAGGAPLTGKDMPGRSFQGPLPPATAAQKRLASQLKADVTHLAVAIGERNHRVPHRLTETRKWLSERFQSLGYQVRPQIFQADGREFANLECTLAGRRPEVLVIGAHYDSAHNCPAANDNGSGVASLLALAGRLRSSHPGCTLRFVAFANEEPPYFQTEAMGSLVYARACQKRGDRLKGMLSLETLGCYSDQPGSQHYPAPFSLLYPSVGNFVAFVSDEQSGPFLKQCVGSFRQHASFPSEGAGLSSMFEGVGWSDHWSFWQIGVPAVMVTDTAPFRYKDYHCPSDTPDKLDYGRLARVVEGLEHVVRDLAR